MTSYLSSCYNLVVATCAGNTIVLPPIVCYEVRAEQLSYRWLTNFLRLAFNHDFLLTS